MSKNKSTGPQIEELSDADLDSVDGGGCSMGKNDRVAVHGKMEVDTKVWKEHKGNDLRSGDGMKYVETKKF